MPDDRFNFEQALEKLNTIVTEMEQGLPLEGALQRFEEGIGLTRQCQKALQEAELKVQILMEKNGDFCLNEYQNED